MSKGPKNKNVGKNTEKDKIHENKAVLKKAIKNNDYLFSMSHAPVLGETTHWFALLPTLIFTAFVVLIVRMATYERAMQQFYWSTHTDKLTDFFSYYKMIVIVACAILALVILLYKVFTQSFYIKRSIAYIPMIVYSAFVLLSYFFSEYKEVALWGWNDRFEGTLSLLGYMIILFFTINFVNSERNVKWIIYALAGSSALLGLLGITQAANHDFFKTEIGKKLITPSSFWNNLDNLNFTFTDQIYQTVYNINYVSFYLTLLIPIFGLLFIRSIVLGKREPIYKKILWGALFALLVFNLIGSASSGGLMGMAFVVLVAVIVLNKRILAWWKPVVVLIAIALVVFGISYQRWMPEFTDAVGSLSGEQSVERAKTNNLLHKLDYIITSGTAIEVGYQGDAAVIHTYPDDPKMVTVTDEMGTPLTLSPEAEGKSVYRFDDKRFNWMTLRPGQDDKGENYIVLSTDGHDWIFKVLGSGPRYLNGVKNLVALEKVPAIGWANNQSFGTGRGYIWSRTIPMIKDTLLIGHGADTYCIYFPQSDYVGKYNSGSFTNNVNVIVDKPHDMYMDYIIGTGMISMLALLVLWLSYLVQSFRIYRKNLSLDFINTVGQGITLGICGFLVAAIVNDSSVSVTPMFYGLLGTGIAINLMLEKSQKHE